MKSLGFEVPPFIVLDSREILSGVAKIKIEAFVRSFPLETSFAVRSSGSVEDGEESSFAGIMESYLNQRGVQEIIDCATRVLESAYSERALAYRQHRLQGHEVSEISVIVQKMVFAGKAGVLFTADPTTGNRRRSVVSAAYGCCEGVVSGLSDCDEFHVEAGKVIKSKIEKKVAGRRTSVHVSGVESFQVPIDLALRPVLEEAQILRLDRLGRTLARECGQALDIEWAIEQEQVYLLQCRPISSQALRRELNAPKIVFDNSNIQESFCGVTLPLTFSFASRAYCSAYSQLMRVAGFSEAQVQKHSERHRNMISSVRGRVYYNINNWYEGLKLLPSFKRNKEDMEKMMGLERPVDFISSETLSTLQRITLLPRLLRTLSNLVFNFLIMKFKYKKFTSLFDEEYARVRAIPLGESTSLELHQLLKKISLRFLALWDTPLYNDFYVMVYNGKVTRRLKALGLEDKIGDLLLVEGLESTEPTKKLIAIAEQISKNSEVLSLFQNCEGDIWSEIRRASPDLFAQCEKYIEAYGDRVAGELKLETLTLREDRSFFISIIKSYLQSEKLNLRDLLEKEARARNEAEAKVIHILRSRRGLFSILRFKSDLEKLRDGIFNRESMRLRRTRLFGLVRMIYAEIGSRWASAGILSQKRDVFFLTEDEITQYFEGRAPSSDLKSLVLIRQSEYAAYEREEVPNHIQAEVPIYNKQFDIAEPKDLTAGLEGTGCYPGIVEGEVDVRLLPGDPKTLQGKILCTLRTDPGWAPVFFNIRGLVVERGSTLSHSAIIARELGIPAIVGVDQVTKRLHTGEVVVIDGQKGTISSVPSNKPEETNEFKDHITL